MPKSSRSKSHQSDKHSSRDAMKRSDSEDRRKRLEKASAVSGDRVSRNTEGKKRESFSPHVSLERVKVGAENGDSSSGKKRKERGEDFAKPGTCNGSINDDRLAEKCSKTKADDRLAEKGSKPEAYGPVVLEKANNSKSRNSRHGSSTERHGDDDRTESVKRKSEKEQALRDYRDHKEKGKERYSERENVRERELVRDKNAHNSRHGRSDAVESRIQHCRSGGVEVEQKAKKESEVREEELKKAPEKHTKKSSSCGSDRALDDGRNCDDKRLSSRNDSIKNGSNKVDRNMDERCKDDRYLGKHCRDLDKDQMDRRHRDTRHRGHSSRIYTSDQHERNSSRDRDKPSESYKKSKLNRSDSELGPSADDCVVKSRENRALKMSYDENDEHYGLKKERTNISRSDRDKDASNSRKFDYGHQGKVDSSLTSMLLKNSSSPQIPNLKEQFRRGLEQEECIHRESVCDERAGPTKDNDRFSVAHEIDFALLSSEKMQHKDGMNADFQNAEPASVAPEPFKQANHFPGSSPGLLIPQSSMVHVMNNPPICDDGMRIAPRDCRSKSHYRSCDPNIERGQIMAWRNGPTWPAPSLNGFIPFQQRPPNPKFHPSVQYFPPSLFGAWPHMDMNQTRIHYQSHEVADRIRSVHHYSGWHHPVDGSVLPQMNGWDDNSSPFGCKLQSYGRSDWNQNRHLMGSHGEICKGQNPNTIEIPSSQEAADKSINVSPSFTSNSEVDHFGHASHAATQVKQLSDPSDNKSKEASEPPKIFKDDSKYFCSYLSKIEISTDLTHPELYKEIADLLTSANSAGINNVSMDEGAKNNSVQNSAKFSNQRRSLSQDATAAATAFKGAMSVYEKQMCGRQRKPRDVAVATNTSSTSDSEKHDIDKSAASPVGGKEGHTDAANSNSPIDMVEDVLVECHGGDDCKKQSDGLTSNVVMETSLQVCKQSDGLTPNVVMETSLQVCKQSEGLTSNAVMETSLQVCEDTVTPLCKVNLIRIHAPPNQTAH